MLPDGAHNRDHDWTIFFLNQAGAQVGTLLAIRGSWLPPSLTCGISNSLAIMNWLAEPSGFSGGCSD